MDIRLTAASRVNSRDALRKGLGSVLKTRLVHYQNYDGEESSVPCQLGKLFYRSARDQFISEDVQETVRFFYNSIFFQLYFLWILNTFSSFPIFPIHFLEGKSVRFRHFIHFVTQLFFLTNLIILFFILFIFFIFSLRFFFLSSVFYDRLSPRSTIVIWSTTFSSTSPTWAVSRCTTEPWPTGFLWRSATWSPASVTTNSWINKSR